MKIALCLSGHMRSFLIAYPTIKKFILDKYNPDIFISTYKSLGFWTQVDNDGTNDRGISFPNLEKEINHLFRPKKMVWQEDNNQQFLEMADDILYKDDKPRLRWGRKQNIIGMFYNIYVCNELKKDYENELGFVYDIVIRLRPDVFIKSMDDIYAPVDGHLYILYEQGYYSDWFFYGNSRTIDIVSEIYKNLEKIYRERNCIFDGHDLIGHGAKFLLNNDDCIKLVNIDVSLQNTPTGYCK